MQTTVIIPVYNRATMLAQALKSLQWQTYKNFVVIICDDASQENLKEVVERFGDLNIEYHRYEINVGQFKNLERGVKLCHTPFMKYLCSDDILFPNALEEQVAVLQQTPNAAICLGGYVEFQELQEHNRIILKNSLLPYVPEVRTDRQWARVKEFNCYFPSASMYRTELFREVGGINTGLQTIADWEMYLALSYRYPVVSVPKLICAYRRHAGQIVQASRFNSDALAIKDLLWMTSDDNPYRSRVSMPLTQQVFLRQQICWASLRAALESKQRSSLLKKWLEIVVLNQMLFPLIFGLPFWAFLKILRKPKVIADNSKALNTAMYTDKICSILFGSES